MVKIFLKIIGIPLFLLGIIFVIIGVGSLIIVWLEGGPNPPNAYEQIVFPLLLAGAGQWLILRAVKKFKDK